MWKKNVLQDITDWIVCLFNRKLLGMVISSSRQYFIPLSKLNQLFTKVQSKHLSASLFFKKLKHHHPVSDIQ